MKWLRTYVKNKYEHSRSKRLAPEFFCQTFHPQRGMRLKLKTINQILREVTWSGATREEMKMERAGEKKKKRRKEKRNE